MNPTPPPALPVTPMVNEVRLSGRQWVIAVLLIGLAALLIPRLWPRVERFETGPDYRIPYALSKDYWLWQRRLNEAAGPRNIVMLGDSVVWGEYVMPDGAWSHFMNQEAGGGDRFINGGVNGLFPLALGGLVEDYGGALHNRKVLLHCNVLWLSSPKADLSATKEEKFNHARLVPQFFPRIPCYRADANERIGVLMERNLGLIAWVNHLQNAYFDQKSILTWTLASDGEDPPKYPNSYKNPLAQIRLAVPVAPATDPERGPQSPRHQAWTKTGGPAQFEWVDLSASLQWAAFQRLVACLRARGNDFFVVLGPFNEHMIAPESQLGYTQARDGIAAWLTAQNVPHLVPETLPSELYADASHPLTAGYALLSQRTTASPAFRQWLEK